MKQKSKTMNWFNRLFHNHSFDIKDVMNLNIDPLCTCGKTFSQVLKEKKYPSEEEMRIIRRITKLSDKPLTPLKPINVTMKYFQYDQKNGKLFYGLISYPVSDELKKLLKDGQVIGENEFRTKQDCKDDSSPPYDSYCFHCHRSQGCDAPIIAIPLPEQTNKVNDTKYMTNKVKEAERLFTLDDIRNAFIDSRQLENHLDDDSDSLYPNVNVYLTQKFGIDIKNNQP